MIKRYSVITGLFILATTFVQPGSFASDTTKSPGDSSIQRYQRCGCGGVPR